MKRLFGIALAAGLALGFANVTFESAQAAAHSTGLYTPVSSQCITYQSNYYCLNSYFTYGCIWYSGYIYCPAPPPTYHKHHYHNSYNGGSTY